MRGFSSERIKPEKDRERKAVDGKEIFVVCPVKNELTFLKRFIPYYREMGVSGFLFIDNNSDDGTREFLLGQPDVTLFSCPYSYLNISKDGWISQAIAYNGLNQWYLVLDADEFLTWPGMEDSSVKELVSKFEETGIKAARGFLLDMYPDYPLFDPAMDRERFMEDYIYFDPDSDWYVRDGIRLTGGMRGRTLGVYTSLQKTAVMWCSAGTVPFGSTHMMDWEDGVADGFFYVLRHYKFLPGDYAKIKATTVRGSGYYSAERQGKYLDLAGVNIKDDNSLRYHDSASLAAFHFIKQLI
jgi:hypothetical protein